MAPWNVTRRIPAPAPSLRRRCHWPVWIVLALVLVSVRPVAGQTSNSYPMLMSLQPVAAQVGRSSDHILSARYNLAGATQVLVSGTGVAGEIVADEISKPEDASRNDVGSSKCKLRFTLEPNALTGVRDFRVLTPHGVSTVGQLVVVRDPVIVEAAENDVPEKAQKIDLPAAVCGFVEKAEDVDFFRFAAAAGESLTFHVRSQRLLNRLHDMQSRIDPMIVLRDAQGNKIAVSDNYYAGDPLLEHKFEREGEYLLEVRDVRYQGNADWGYCIEIHSRPFVTQVFPNAIQAGTPTPVTLIGHRLGTGMTATILIPEVAGRRPLFTMPSLNDIVLNEVSLWGTDQAVQVDSRHPPTAGSSGKEETSNSAAGELSQLESYPLVTWPGTIAGLIETPGEVDRFAFEAKAQEKIAFQVFSRRGGSELDPVLRILDARGVSLTEVDDGTFDRVNQADCWLESWTAPADGKYLLEIRDLHQRGGTRFPYAVEVSRADPYFLLEADTDKTLLAPGMGSAVFVRTIRKNGFTGDVQLAVEGLPAGVTATCGRVLADGNDGCIVLRAAADATPLAANVSIFGTATTTLAGGEPRELRSAACPLQEYYSPGGGRGNYPVDAHTISVAQPMDIRSIELSTAEIVLKPGGAQRIDIKVERAPDYKGNVTLDVIMQHLEQPYGNSLPKGVKVDVAASKTLLTGGDDQGHITLVAAADAPAVEKQLVPVLAHVSINFVMKHTFCVQPLSVSVRK